MAKAACENASRAAVTRDLAGVVPNQEQIAALLAFSIDPNECSTQDEALDRLAQAVNDHYGARP
jgi:hypothetical protein